MIHFYKYLTIFWAVMIIPGVLFWKNSVPFLVAVSIYANFQASWSTWEAVKAKREASGD